MTAYRKVVTLTEPGRIVIDGLPIKSGQRVEVVVLVKEPGEALATEMEALFRETQALPGVSELTEEDIEAEIAAYRAGR